MKLEISVIQNKTAAVKGVKLIDAFNDQRFSLSTVQGELQIWGKNLRIRKWDAEQGLLMIEGTIFAAGSSEWPETARIVESEETAVGTDRNWWSPFRKWFV